jgi:hypothetical protein
MLTSEPVHTNQGVRMDAQAHGSPAATVSIPRDHAKAALFATNSACIGAKITITDLDDVYMLLQDLLRRVEQFELTHEPAAEDLFTPRFMLAHTAFDSFDQMVTAAGTVIVHSINELETNEHWQRFVTGQTRFESWEEMREEAACEWTANELGLTQSEPGATRWQRHLLSLPPNDVLQGN